MEEEDIYSGYYDPMAIGRIIPNADGSTKPDWEDVACYLPNTAIKATGQLQWTKLDDRVYTQNVSGERWCSGTLIDHDLFLTAGHCITPQKPPRSRWITPIDKRTKHQLNPHEFARLMKVNFSYQYTSCPDDTDTRTLAEEVSYNISELVEYRHDRAYDYAIVRLSYDGRRAPGVKYGIASLSAVLPIPGSDVYVVQHPGGAPKKASKGKIVGYSKNRAEMFYDADTEGGSSGGPVYNLEGEVVAVHNGGTSKRNYGTTIYSLRTVSPTISGLVQSSFFRSSSSQRAVTPTATSTTASRLPNQVSIPRRDEVSRRGRQFNLEEYYERPQQCQCDCVLF